MTKEFICVQCGEPFSMYSRSYGNCENCGRIDKNEYDYGDAEE